MARILNAAALLAAGSIAVAALATPAPSTSPANAAAGATYFRGHCAVCHGNSANSPPGVGPRLFGVVGRRAGTFPGYAYSPAMKAAGFVWTPDQLKHYLVNPQALVHGNKMPFAGIPAEGDRANVVAYLQTLR